LKEQSNARVGRLIAVVLAGAWRSSPPTLELSPAALNLVAEKLLISRAGALAWWRLRHTELRSSAATQELYDAYRLFTLKAALHERDIELVFARLRAAGIEPILIKGWSIARFYPEAGLRPYGDIDLCVSRDDFAHAQEVLKTIEAGTIDVDLVPCESGRLGNRSWEEFFPRTHVEQLGKTGVRVLGPEDHLRVLCVHMLKGPRMSPVLLCDIALMIENLPAGFDWGLCLGDRPESDWIACAVGLAHRLLDARTAHTPVAARARNLPGWLVSEVLKQWATYRPMEYMAPLTTYLRRPKGIATALRTRWPSPIESSVVFKRPFTRTPPLPYQLGRFISLRKVFINQLLDTLSRRNSAP
jgi:Uncharacterised nucleotidyltransferase